MELTFKKFAFNERLSEDSNNFSADVYVNGKKAFQVSDDGRGGSHRIMPYGEAGKKLYAEAKAWAESLPPRMTVDGFSVSCDLEVVIGEMVNDKLLDKDMARIKKSMSGKTRIITKDDSGFAEFEFKHPFDDKIKAHIEQKYNPKNDFSVIIMNELEDDDLKLLILCLAREEDPLKDGLLIASLEKKKLKESIDAGNDNDSSSGMPM